LQNSKHGQNVNKEETDKLWRKTILLRFLLIIGNVELVAYSDAGTRLNDLWEQECPGEGKSQTSGRSR
jgi:hypothetical protein